ncbi:MAG: hypothetical protein ACYDDA_07290 [Acidiferrobacteraceae bacterium]
MKYTQYFQSMRQRPDRAVIQLEWIDRVVTQPVKEAIQQDGRIRRWAPIPEAGGKMLRVILLPDGETIHNAFFESGYVP